MEPPDTGVWRPAEGGTGRELGWRVRAEGGGRGGVSAGSRRRPDRHRFLPERRPAQDPGADQGRARAGDGEIPRPARFPRLATVALVAPPSGQLGAGWLGGGGGRRRGARAGAWEGGKREGPGAPVTGWQPRSGRVAAAAAPPPSPAAPLAAAAAAATAVAGRSFTPHPCSESLPRAEQGAWQATAASGRRGARSARTPSRRRRLGGVLRPGLGARRRRRGGCEPRDPRAASRPPSERPCTGQ